MPENIVEKFTRGVKWGQRDLKYESLESGEKLPTLIVPVRFEDEPEEVAKREKESVGIEGKIAYGSLRDYIKTKNMGACGEMLML